MINCIDKIDNDYICPVYKPTLSELNATNSGDANANLETLVSQLTASDTIQQCEKLIESASSAGKLSDESVAKLFNSLRDLSNVQDQNAILFALIAFSLDAEFAEKCKNSATVDQQLCSMMDVPSKKSLKNVNNTMRAIYSLQLLINIYQDQSVVVLKIQKANMDHILKIITAALQCEDIYARTFACFALRTLFGAYIKVSTPKTIPDFITYIVKDNGLRSLVSLAMEHKATENQIESVLACIAKLTLFKAEQSFADKAHVIALKFISEEAVSQGFREQALDILANMSQGVDEPTRKKIASSVILNLIQYLKVSSATITIDDLDSILQIFGSLFVFESVYTPYKKYSSELTDIILHGLKKFCPETQKKSLYEKQIDLVRHGIILLLQFCYNRATCKEAMMKGALMYTARILKISPDSIKHNQLAFICQIFLQHGVEALDVVDLEDNKADFESFIAQVEELVKHNNKELVETAIYAITAIADAHKKKLSQIEVSTSATPGPGAISCHKCGKENALSRCARCRQVFYCGRDCQVQDWSVHKQNCRAPN